jgi:hypothetical protein
LGTRSPPRSTRLVRRCAERNDDPDDLPSAAAITRPITGSRLGNGNSAGNPCELDGKQHGKHMKNLYSFNFGLNPSDLNVCFFLEWSHI